MKLIQAIELYVAGKRARGLRYTQSTRHFYRFARFVGDVDLVHVTTESVSAYLGPPKTNTATWLTNYIRLEKFFIYWRFRQEMSTFDMPPRPSRARVDTHSYVYTVSELREMLDAVGACQANEGCCIDAETLRMCVVLLYATGITVCELLDLRPHDVDFRRSQLTVWNRKYGRSRIVPIGKDLRCVLRAFQKRETSRTSSSLLHTKLGTPVQAAPLTYAFGRLRRIAGVGRGLPQAASPRLLDFRTTFAVGRIRAWIQQGADLNRMLPALAAYLGQGGLGSIDRYLDLTPESFTPHLDALT